MEKVNDTLRATVMMLKGEEDEKEARARRHYDASKSESEGA